MRVHQKRAHVTAGKTSVRGSAGTGKPVTSGPQRDRGVDRAQSHLVKVCKRDSRDWETSKTR